MHPISLGCSISLGFDCQRIRSSLDANVLQFETTLIRIDLRSSSFGFELIFLISFGVIWIRMYLDSKRFKFNLFLFRCHLGSRIINSNYLDSASLAFDLSCIRLIILKSKAESKFKSRLLRYGQCSFQHISHKICAVRR